jgi:uncharacterized membrane protein
MDTLFSILHVVGAVFIVGPMAILPMTGMRALRAGAAGPVRTIAKSTFVVTLISIAVALLGFALVGMAPAKYDLHIWTPWVLASIILWLVALALSLALVVPGLRSGASSIEGGTAVGSAYSRVAAGSGAASLALLAVVVLMVWKP